ncbi:class I SAM-dependent methyltransferase [Mycolicibacterium sp. CBMA 234]|uniref:class I SAM-dependent methyltransferase n=1 Tax=Mycolicibacterium sp. CBMA 234 TaxID=1918495 RepID=UPI001390FB78|nr:methyltransferase domain-containing protein [Mycolicibacterium sp. CBMA 234]
MTRQLRDEPRVLDVACGPGDLTRFTANLLDDNAFAIGLDDSAFVIKRAARANRHPRAVYMRAEPAQLPFNDRTFDAVCCFAGLNRVPDPDAALSEMVRVLAPGGSIAVLASHGGETPFLRRALEFCARSGGTRTFDRNTVTAAMTSAGLTDIEQQLRGMSQFVTARRPESANQLDAWRVHRRAPR